MITKTPTPMTLAEKSSIIDKYIELKNAGKLSEAIALIKTVPVPPYLAKAFKEAYGSNALVSTGFNLDEAEAEYGSGWLE